MPLISVLLPVRNAASTLNQALASLRSQTLTDWEAIIVDDGSTDESPALLESWMRKDERFSVYRATEHRGLVASLNQALSEAQGEIVARMDADDVALSTRFERQAAALERGDGEILGCRVRYFVESSDVGAGTQRYECWLNSLISPEEHARDIFIDCPLAHPTLMLRRELLESAGGYRAMGWAEDYDLLLRLWIGGARLAKTPERLLLWRDHPTRLARTHPDYWHASFFRARAHFLARSYLAEGRPALIFGAGQVGKTMARALQREGCCVEAFVDPDAGQIDHEIHGIPVIGEAEAAERKGRVFGLAALGEPGARETVRHSLDEAGWIEGVDFCCVA